MLRTNVHSRSIRPKMLVHDYNNYNNKNWPTNINIDNSNIHTEIILRQDMNIIPTVYATEDCKSQSKIKITNSQSRNLCTRNVTILRPA